MDRGFNLEPRGADCTDCPHCSVRVPRREATDPDRAAIVVTLCACLFIATVGIVYLMATGHNVAKEVSLAIAAQWGALLAVYAKGNR